MIVVLYTNHLPTTAGVDFTAPLVVIDLSAVYHSPALPVVMTCVAAWTAQHTGR